MLKENPQVLDLLHALWGQVFLYICTSCQQMVQTVWHVAVTQYIKHADRDEMHAFIQLHVQIWSDCFFHTPNCQQFTESCGIKISLQSLLWSQTCKKQNGCTHLRAVFYFIFIYIFAVHCKCSVFSSSANTGAASSINAAKIYFFIKYPLYFVNVD